MRQRGEHSRSTAHLGASLERQRGLIAGCAHGPGYLLGNKADPGVSLWESKEEFSDKGKMFPVKFRGWEYNLRAASCPPVSAKSGSSYDRHSSGTLLLTRTFFLSLAFSLVSELPVFLGKVCYCFLRYFRFFKCREAGLRRTQNQLFSWLSVFFCVRWEGKFLFYLFFLDWLVS